MSTYPYSFYREISHYLGGEIILELAALVDL
jgi:hypothetical protein